MKRKKRGGLYKQPGSPHWFADYIDGSGKRRRRPRAARTRRTPSGYVPPGRSKLAGAQRSSMPIG